MLNFLYCTLFKKKIQGQSYEKHFHNKLEELSSRKALTNGGSLKDYTNGLYVLKTYTPNSRIIIEERTTENCKLYLVRDIIINKDFDDYYGSIIHPILKSGEWLTNMSLSPEDESAIEEKIQESNKSYCKQIREKPPKHLVNWLNDFTIDIKHDIFETEEWVRYALSDSLSEGMSGINVKVFRLLLSDIVLSKTINYGTELLKEVNGIKIMSSVQHGIGIIYSIVSIEKNDYYILFGGAHLKTQPKHWSELKASISNEEIPFQVDIESISRYSFRAYPKWTINDDELWFAIQKNSELSNLSLTQEQIDFFRSFKFPYYINGQAGSGKSTMLYYLFANACYYKIHGEITGDIIFLTENKQLLENSKQSVFDLLTNNPDFELSIEERDKVGDVFASFKFFLINILPEEERSQFKDSYYLYYSLFKELYENSQLPTYIKSKYTAEESWFTIITYIYGYSNDEKVTSENYDKIVNEKSRIIPKEKFKGIEEYVLPFYEKLINENGYWDKLKIIRHINENIDLLPKYSLVVCDEAQDFCKVELKFILKLSEYLRYDLSEIDQVPVVFAGDPNQTVNPTGFREREMTRMLYEELKEIASFDLKTQESVYNPTYNYRSCYPVVTLANYVQYFRKKNLEIRQAFPQEAKRPKSFDELQKYNSFFSESSIVNDNELKETLAEKIKYKVFIVPVDIQEKKKFINDRIFLSSLKKIEIKTSVEAKGAEYEQVVLYGFGEYFLENFKSFENEENEEEKFRKRYFFNKLYVGVTRAQNELIIIDSTRAKDEFWKKLTTELEIADILWDVLKKNQIEVILYDPGTLNHIIESTPKIAEENAEKDKKQGIYESNPARLKVAANQFINLGQKGKGYECLAISEKIKGNWKGAGDLFNHESLEGRTQDESADCYFQGMLFGEVLSFGKNLKNEKQDLRIIISRLMRAELLLDHQIGLLYTYKETLRELINNISWRNDFISRIIKDASTERETDVTKELAYTLEFIAKDYEHDLWKVIGELFYKATSYKNAINAWTRIDYTENTEFFNAQIEIAKGLSDYESCIIWLGRKVAVVEIDNQKTEIENEIIKLFIEKFQKLIGYRPLFYLSIFRAHLLQNPYKNIDELCFLFEEAFKERIEFIVDFYDLLLSENRLKSKVAEFVLERWARISGLLYKKIDENSSLQRINDRIEEWIKTENISISKFDLTDLTAIPIKPEDILWSPPKHISSVIIQNFRKIKKIEFSDLGQFNLIVGDNNVGKTSILEAFLFSDDKHELFSRLAYAYAERSNPLRVAGENSTYRFILEPTFVKDFIKKDEKIIKYTIKERRASWNYKVISLSEEELYALLGQNIGIDPDKYFGFQAEGGKVEVVDLSLIIKKLDVNAALKIPFIPFGKGYGRDLAQTYSDEIDKKKSSRIHFLKNMEIFIPNIERINVDTEKGLIEIEESGIEDALPIHQFGEGANKLFRILVQIAVHQNARLSIDEIDAGIHYSHFKDFWKIIIQFAQKYNTQIFASTHNIECVNFFKEILDDSEFEAYQSKSRVITLRELPNKNIKAFPRNYEEFKYELENDFEIRGGIL